MHRANHKCFGSKPGFWLIIQPSQSIKGLPGWRGTPKVKHIDVHEVVEPASTPHRVEQPLLLVCDDRLPIEGHRVAGTVCHGQLGELLVLELAGHHGVASGEAKRSSGSSTPASLRGDMGVLLLCEKPEGGIWRLCQKDSNTIHLTNCSGMSPFICDFVHLRVVKFSSHSSCKCKFFSKNIITDGVALQNIQKLKVGGLNWTDPTLSWPSILHNTQPG